MPSSPINSQALIWQPTEAPSTENEYKMNETVPSVTEANSIQFQSGRCAVRSCFTLIRCFCRWICGLILALLASGCFSGIPQLPFTHNNIHTARTKQLSIWYSSFFLSYRCKFLPPLTQLQPRTQSGFHSYVLRSWNQSECAHWRAKVH